MSDNGHKMKVRIYSSCDKTVWDEFVRKSRQQSFLLTRDFMDYHADRFTDCSVMVHKCGKDEETAPHNLVALLPANFDLQTRTVYSHQGLTYGGLITRESATQTDVIEIFDAILQYYSVLLRAESLVYKPIPYIYSTIPAQEDLYALFRLDATIEHRLVSTVIDLRHCIKMRTLRMRGVRKAQNGGLYIEGFRGFQKVSEGKEGSEGREGKESLEDFWNILNDVLEKDHNTRPVHTVSEMELLMERFPDEIKLYVVKDRDGKVVAGSWVFETTNVIHTQYIAASQEGKQLGALDYLFYYLITERYADRRYIDFGNSNEEGGRVLNEGLIFQKEGFGGRAVCYDQYRITIKS